MEEIMALIKITISCTTSGLKIVGCPRLHSIF